MSQLKLNPSAQNYFTSRELSDIHRTKFSKLPSHNIWTSAWYNWLAVQTCKNVKADGHLPTFGKSSQLIFVTAQKQNGTSATSSAIFCNTTLCIIAQINTVAR